MPSARKFGGEGGEKRHVDSRLDDMATVARGLEEKAGRSASGVSRRRRGARLIYDAVASYSRAGGGIDQRRRNRAAATQGRGGISSVVYSRASAEMPRAAADASHLVPGIGQTAARPKKIAAPP
jgi:hypothetical protein